MPKTKAMKQTSGVRKAAKTSPTNERTRSPSRANKESNTPTPTTSHGKRTVAEDFAFAEDTGRSGAATARKKGGKRAADETDKGKNAPATVGSRAKRAKSNQANSDHDSIGAANRLGNTLLDGVDDFDSDDEEKSGDESADDAALTTQAPTRATSEAELKGLTKAALIARLQALETNGRKDKATVAPKRGSTKGKRDVSSDCGSISSEDEPSEEATKVVRDADHVLLKIQKSKAKSFLKSDDAFLMLRRLSPQRAEELLDLGCLDLNKILSALSSFRNTGAIKTGLKHDASSSALDVGPLKRSPAAAGNPLLREKAGVIKLAHGDFSMRELLRSPFKSPPGLAGGLELMEAMWCTLAALTRKSSLESIPVLCRAWASSQISAQVDESAVMELITLHTEAVLLVLKTEQRHRVTGYDGTVLDEFPFADHKAVESWLLSQYGDTTVTVHVPQVADLESALSTSRMIGSREEKALIASAQTRWGKSATEQDQGKPKLLVKKPKGGGASSVGNDKPKPRAKSEELCRIWALSDYIGRNQKAGGCSKPNCRWEHRLPASKAEAEQLVDYAKLKLEAKRLTTEQAASVKAKLDHLLE